jgi:hypothetical protein
MPNPGHNERDKKVNNKMLSCLYHSGGNSTTVRELCNVEGIRCMELDEGNIKESKVILILDTVNNPLIPRLKNKVIIICSEVESNFHASNKIYYLPKYFSELIGPTTASFHSFSFDTNLIEYVSDIDRCYIFSYFRRLLRKVFIFTEGLYRHIWYYPKGHKNVFTFRIDADGYDGKSIEHAHKFAINHKLSFSWFVDVYPAKDYLSHYAELNDQGQDIQLHCYRHLHYKGYKKLQRNINTGMQLLQDALHKPVTGFAEPFSRWNENLQKVINDLGFEYSCEFSWGFDCFPLRPFYFGGLSDSFQIPVHPICIGILRNAGYSTRMMIDYFELHIKRMLQEDLPLMLYSHPIGEMDKYPEVVNEIFHKIRNYPSIWLGNYQQWITFWKRRQNILHSTDVADSNLEIREYNQTSEDEFHSTLSLDQPRISLWNKIKFHLRTEANPILWMYRILFGWGL